jgi:adenylate cyclase
MGKKGGSGALLARRFGARLALAAAPLVLLLPASLGLVSFETLNRIESYLYDLRVRATARPEFHPTPAIPIAIVDIDERSLALEGHWPWSRAKLARLVDRLFDAYGARVVAFDVMFPEPDDASAIALIDELSGAQLDAATRAQLERRRPAYDADARFAEAVIARDVVLGFAFVASVQPDVPTEKGALPPPLAIAGSRLEEVPWIEARGFVGNYPALQANAPAGGFFDIPVVDDDGIVRRLPLLQRYQGAVYESLALATVRLARADEPVKLGFRSRRDGSQRLEFMQLGASLIPVDARGTALVPFRGGVGSFPYVSATNVLRGEAPAARLKDAIVLVGTSAAGLYDVRPTPVQAQYIGVEAHANLVAGILANHVLARPAWSAAFDTATLIVLALMFAFVMPRLSQAWSIAVLVGLVAAVLAVNVNAWVRAGIVLPLATPLVYVLIAVLLLLNYVYFVESRRKRRLSRIFGQYVPAEIVRELDASEAEVSLEGESREMTVLFSDVRGFTTLSEGLSPRDLTRLMNEMLTPLTGAIHQRRGTIDKYMGDAIMAFWGAPLADPEHARNAVLAALDMLHCAAQLREEFAKRGWPAVHIGVGVSSGAMNVGNMGSRFRMAYTVLGDTVNLGSRLEGLTKQYGVGALASARTAELAADIAFRPLDLVRVKGKHEPVTIFEPLGLRTELDGATLARAARTAELLERYRARDFDGAVAVLDALERERHEKLLDVYRARIMRYRVEPPPGDWDGVFVHENK